MDEWRAHGEVIVFAETRAYVARVEKLQADLRARVRERAGGRIASSARFCVCRKPAPRADRRRERLVARLADDVPRPALVRPRDDGVADAHGRRPRGGAVAGRAPGHPQRHARVAPGSAANDVDRGHRAGAADGEPASAARKAAGALSFRSLLAIVFGIGCFPARRTSPRSA